VGLALAEGETREVTFRLGLGGVPGGDDANRLVHRFRGPAAARRALEAVWLYWNHTLGEVQVETPDQSLNVLANGWLLYQTLACRIWAHSGYYQSGGAFGFRDQLQDAMALVHAEPGCCGRNCCCAPVANSARGMYSTGGTRPSAAGCAPTVPATGTTA
jgi:cellobiose phosphorylase